MKPINVINCPCCGRRSAVKFRGKRLFSPGRIMELDHLDPATRLGHRLCDGTVPLFKRPRVTRRFRI